MGDFNPEIKNFIQEAQLALDQGVLPIRSKEATAEAYVLLNRNQVPIAFFKMATEDEVICECVGYRLDHAGFCSVPPTTEALLRSEVWQGGRKGAFQLFAGEGKVMGQLPFAAYKNVPPEQVRKIAILDIRLINSDRHEYNLIFDKEKLIPIDHSRIFTTNSLAGFIWTSWHQSHTPFSEEEKKYIEQLNPMEDYSLLIEEFGFEPKRAATCYLATLFLKIGMKCGLTAGEIGGLMLLRQMEGFPMQVCIFKQLFDQIEKLPMHTWDEHVRKTIEGISTCV